MLRIDACTKEVSQFKSSIHDDTIKVVNDARKILERIKSKKTVDRQRMMEHCSCVKVENIKTMMRRLEATRRNHTMDASVGFAINRRHVCAYFTRFKLL